MKSKQSLFLMGARILSALVTLISMRFFITWFGEERYGTYLVGQNFFIFVGLIDPGIFVGGARRITEAFHHDRIEEGWAIHRTQLTLGSLIVSLGILTFALLGFIFPLKTFPIGTSVLLMSFLGVQFAAAWLLQYIASALAARDKFSLQGTMTFLSTFTGAVSALILGWRTQDLLMVAAGYGFGTMAGLCLGLIWIKIKDPDFRFGLGFDREIAKDLTHQGLTNYPNRVAGTFSNRSDRQIMGLQNAYVITAGHYQFISRPVEIMTDLIGGAIETTQPDITRSVQVGPEETAAKLHRNALVIWAMACCLMIVPSAFGDTVLRIWVPGKVFPYAGFVMICTALNYAGELHYRALGTVYVARGTLYRSVWFPALNGIATVILTLPVVRAYGLAGIGVMNAGFSLIQLYPRITHVVPETGGQFPVGRHFFRTMAILLVALAFTGAAYYLSQNVRSAWIVLLAPFCAVGSLFACLWLKLSPAPRFLAKFGFQVD